MRKKRLVSLAVVGALLCIALSACGKSEEVAEEPAEEAVQEEVQEEVPEVEEEPVEEVVEEPEEVVEEPEEDLPYAEENGFTFTTDRLFNVPLITYTTSDGIYTEIDGLTASGMVDAELAITDIYTSEPDEDGMVQITITATEPFKTTLTNDASVYEGGVEFGWVENKFEVLDYYTGTVVPFRELITNDDNTTDSDEYAVDITYEDKTYSVSCATSMEQDVSFDDWVEAGGDIYTQDASVDLSIVYIATVPEDYDGLCLALYMPGESEPYMGEEEEEKDPAPFLEYIDEDRSAQDYVFVRVSDLLAAAE